MTQGRFIAVVGPSGVGKDSVMAGLAAADPRIAVARRVITRDPEAGGEDYQAVTEEQFASMRDAGAFALHWQAHGLHYGIPVAVDQQLAQGTDLLANLSRSVLVQAQARFAGFKVLSLTAPTAVLAQRLAGRGRESAEEIERRLSRSGFPVPDGVPVVEIDNSGPLDQTVAAIRAVLQPDSATR